MGDKVKVKAKSFWTGNAKDGSILHFNPEGSDKLARERLVDVADVERLISEGAIHAPKGFGAALPAEPATVADAAAAKVAGNAENLVPAAGTNTDDTVAHAGAGAADPDTPPAAKAPAAPKTPKPAAKPTKP